MALGCRRRPSIRDVPACSRQSASTIDELYRNLIRTVRKRWRGSDVEDVVQEAFLRLSIAENKVEVRDRAAFLHVTAVNLIRDRLKSEASRRAGLLDVQHLGRTSCEIPSIEQALADRQRLAVLDAAIDELPSNVRVAFLMYRMHHMPQAAIARELSISVSMVEKHICRALAHCRGRLAGSEVAKDARSENVCGRGGES